MDEVIRLFNQDDVRYLLIGGQAVRLHGLPRFSMDWDFYIPPRDPANLEKINRLLAKYLDVPLVPLGQQGENFVQTYQTPSGILQFHLGGIGLPPFDKADAQAVMLTDESGTPVRCLSGRDLLAGKLKSNRPQDQEDIRFLQKKQQLGLL
jgi:hypothetical protein